MFLFYVDFCVLAQPVKADELILGYQEPLHCLSDTLMVIRKHSQHAAVLANPHPTTEGSSAQLSPRGQGGLVRVEG